MTEPRSVDSLLGERIDGEIQSVVWHRSQGSTHIGLVTSIRENETVALTTVVLDLDDETLRVHSKNSMWLPAEGPTIDAAIRSLARSCNAITGSVSTDEPMTESLTEFDAETIGAHTLTDDYEPSQASGDWKETQGRPERYDVHERLTDSPIENADRLIRLEFEAKAPWAGEPQRIMRSPQEIGGNYGVEVGEDDDLVIIDIDDVDEAPTEDFPETLGSRSPHGGSHHFYHVPGWRDHFRERFGGVLNPHPSWGEIRSQDGYVVGPGSILTGCKHGCCTDDEPGRYVLIDAPIATVDAADVGDLIAPYREGSA